ncbi:hypothetical protein KY285_037691 [Solanum tuberosum]|nr:hypothetical protein KY285_037691 [Solanum tuberosum]
MAQKVAEEEDEWGKCLVADVIEEWARAIDVMVSINLERDWLEGSNYNAVDHVEKQETDVIDMKQETLEDVPSGDRVAAIEEIKEEDLKQAVFETTCANDDLYEESIEEDVLEAELYGQSSAISSSKAAKKSIKEMIKEYGSGSYVGVETSQDIDSVSLDNIIIGKLRERGSLKTQQGDNLHGSIDDKESLSFEEARGVRKILLRFSPRCGSKLRLSSSTTSVG